MIEIYKHHQIRQRNIQKIKNNQYNPSNSNIKDKMLTRPNNEGTASCKLVTC